MSDQSFASESSHQDAKSANDCMRSAAQAVILINGAAATALLAYSSHIADRTNPLERAIPYALAGYATGVFFGAVIFVLMWHWLEVWMRYWEKKAGHNKKDIAGLKNP